MPPIEKMPETNTLAVAWDSLRVGEEISAERSEHVTDEQISRLVAGFKVFPESKIWGAREYMTGLKDVLRERNFDKVMSFKFPDGSESFVFTVHIRPHGGGMDTTKQFLVADVLNDQILGEGLIRFSTEGNLNFEHRGNAGVPFVSWTHTRPEFENRGLNERRLEIMNEAVRIWEHSELHSGQGFEEPAAEKTWRRLVSNGRAEQDGELPSGVSSYKFVV